jgi:hypothetical protein
MNICAKCGGFQRGSICPHCGARARKTRIVKALGGAFGGGAIAVTLMACYGMAPCPDGQRDCHHPPPTAPPDKSADGGPDMPTAK